MKNAKINTLMKNIENTNKIIDDLRASKKVIEKEVKSFGNSAHVVISKKYLNKKVKIIIV